MLILHLRVKFPIPKVEFKRGSNRMTQLFYAPIVLLHKYLISFPIMVEEISCLVFTPVLGVVQAVNKLSNTGFTQRLLTSPIWLESGEHHANKIVRLMMMMDDP